MKQSIVNYTVVKENTINNQTIDSRSSVEKNEQILTEANLYNIQVKAFKVNVNFPIITLDEHDTMGMVLSGSNVGGDSFSETFVTNVKKTYYTVEALTYDIIGAFIRLAAMTRQKNPTYTSILYPFIKYDGELGKEILFIPSEYNQSPFNASFYFTPKIAMAYNYGYRDYIHIVDSHITDKYFYRLSRTTNIDHQVNIGTDDYYVYSQRSKNVGITDNDSLVIVAHSIPVSGSIEHVSKRIETQIIKQYKVTSEQIIDNVIVYNNINNDYHELISHYPVSRIDIELYMRKSDGSLDNVMMFSGDSYTVDVEFIKK